MQESAIKKITIQVDEIGADDANKKVAALAKSETELDAATKGRMATAAAAARAQAALNQLSGQQDALTRDLVRSNQLLAASNDNLTGSSSHLSDALRTGAKAAVDYVASHVAMAAGAAAAVVALQRLFAILTPIIITYKLAKEVVTLAAEAWQLGGQELEKYRAIAEKAAAVDLSTSYFQKITKAATDAKLPVDQLTAAFTKLNEATTEKLGGSDLDQQLQKHLDAGNFKGNTGVSALNQANTTEETFKAIVSLIDQAMQKGERLAALDLASTAFGPQMTARLREDSEYLHNLETSAEKISATQLVSDEDIGRALELQNRYDAAVAILETRYHPVQDVLVQLGIKMHEVWVSIVEAVAAVFDGVSRLVIEIAKIPAAFWSYVPKDLTKTALNAVSTIAPTFGPVGAAVGAGAGLVSGAIGSDEKTLDAQQIAVAKLAAGMKNLNAVQQAGAQTTAVYNAVFKDTSHTLDAHKKAIEDTADAYDRALNASQKHVAQLTAEDQAIGLGVGAMEKSRTSAALWTAAMQAGRDITPQLTAAIDAQATAAGKAAEKLAEDKAAAKATFDSQTAGLTGVEKQIADLNYQIYGKDHWKEYGDSATANLMRVADQMKTLNQATNQFASTLVSGLLSGQDVMKSLTSAATSLISTLANKSLSNFLGGGSLFGSQNLASGQGALAVGSAGLAGYQSGSPLGGAVGGALAGATFGPVGAAVGGAVGLIGGIIGADAQSQQKLKQAEDAWKKAGPAFETFLTEMSGGSHGGFSTKFPVPVNDNEDRRDDRDKQREAA
jgi:hypothetical protein